MVPVVPPGLEVDFAALPAPLRLRADPYYTGRGVVIAQVDAGFFPHPDLVRPGNRIRAWVDAGTAELAYRRFGHSETPRWPGWDARQPQQWHGLMTSAVLAGNGYLSRGTYRGLASAADLVLVQVLTPAGRIPNEAIARALRWLLDRRDDLDLGVVCLSVGGDPVMPLRGNAVDLAVARLVAAGVTVVAAAGNDGQRRLVPPATAPEAITVGGVDDRNNFDPGDVALWHSNYGPSTQGGAKPEVLAPSLGLAAPILPGSAVADEVADLFRRRAAGEAAVTTRMRDLHLVTPHYQHVAGTSFAAPLVASLVATLLEANPGLGPSGLRAVLLGAAEPLPDAPPERQGAGVVAAARALALALRAPGGPLAGMGALPEVTPGAVRFLLYQPRARSVRVYGNWNGWFGPGVAMTQVRPGLWAVACVGLPPGRHAYRFLVDDRTWRLDPANPRQVPDGVGALVSEVWVPAIR
jgi:serine protease AprX